MEVDNNDGDIEDGASDIETGPNETQVTIDIIQSDGLPTYDDACRMNNINNNYI